MTRITRISRLRGAGVFRDFEWPDTLAEFGRYNLIYGWNGTGKTTLSRVFRALELRQPWAMGEAVLRMDGGDVRIGDLPQSTLDIRVFNRDFIDESVFRADGGDLLPIFVVGKESVEKQKEVVQRKRARETNEEELSKAREKKQEAERAFDRYCIGQARVIKDTLRIAGGAYNDYDKRDYKERAEQMAADKDAAMYRLSDSDRNKHLAQHRATQKSTVLEVDYQPPHLQDLTEKVGTLLGTTVASAAIQPLKDDPNLAEWTRQGLGLHKERKSDKCLFCEQSLPKDRLAELEAHFNAEYGRFLKTIEEHILALESVVSQAADVKLPDRAELYDGLRAEFDNAEQEFRQVLDTVRKFLGQLIDALKAKQVQPFQASVFSAPVPAVGAAVVHRLNEVIRKHNQLCANFDSEVRASRDRLAWDMVAEGLDEFVQIRNEVNTATAAIPPIENEIARLDQQIAQLEHDISKHQRPAEELNEDLKKYLGHGELQLSIKETGYAVTRNGVPAYMLSEGEMTAIALLYFLKSLEDRGFDKDNGVAVLDDPVSSLDANALYLAFGFIRERTRAVGQLFILTHNFAFFRQVRNWFDYLNKRRKRADLRQRPAQFYMLDRVYGSNPRCTRLQTLDPLLVRYESEYHYLFACVHRAANAPGETELERNYGLPNVARRLLEMFLAFRRPQIAGGLWEKLTDVSFDEVRRVRIYRFVQTHSHGDTVGEPGHDPSLLGEARAVLGDLLELIKSEDAQHFTAMVGLVSSSPAETDSE
ncbi:AAA family ATPase [Methylacidimicrobium tartarophylax]|uniref:Protein CR006 P-loop domain-containing protein n=1 Tax=Methylacidimicrobium tartarophylax TaxID=1041768 RepID=A0A5E6MIV5_9BACT|nr:AAA family ATPase [Methylacidimicrobium tartarophylax]VVM08173.1 hypothetical protein MAMT_02162 [Methylacidimicrobium tartarophylax]